MFSRCKALREIAHTAQVEKCGKMNRTGTRHSKSGRESLLTCDFD